MFRTLQKLISIFQGKMEASGEITNPAKVDNSVMSERGTALSLRSIASTDLEKCETDGRRHDSDIQDSKNGLKNTMPLRTVGGHIGTKR